MLSDPPLHTGVGLLSDMREKSLLRAKPSITLERMQVREIGLKSDWISLERENLSN